MADAEDSIFLSATYARLREILQSHPGTTLPSAEALAYAHASLANPSSFSYLTPLGRSGALAHILSDIVPALTGQAMTARYFGFVTGGAHPAAEAADAVVSALDQNVQVHLPADCVATAVEDATLRMLIALLMLGGEEGDGPGSGADTAWPGRTFTSGATARNVMGLLCGREAVVQRRLEGREEMDGQCINGAGRRGVTVAEMGMLAACAAAGVREIQVLTSMAHSSLRKAASIAGFGHASVKELPASSEEPWRLDLDAVEHELKRTDEGVASIIAVGAGEVNTGRFGTPSFDMHKLRSLADIHGAWIHVDGAFGIFARALPRTDEFLSLHAVSAGLELADSITVDGHKLLNVPYDSAMFFCRNADIQTQVFTNPGAAYLSFPSSGLGNDSQIRSPLNIGIQNSRRFRALPVYAVLLSEGREGMAAMFSRMVLLARGIAAFVRDSEDYEWLPSQDAHIENTHVIVLFRARHPELNERLVDVINETRKMYVSGTVWKGEKAVRVAVSSWRVDVNRDLAVVKEILTLVAARRE